MSKSSKKPKGYNFFIFAVKRLSKNSKISMSDSFRYFIENAKSDSTKDLFRKCRNYYYSNLKK